MEQNGEQTNQSLEREITRLSLVKFSLPTIISFTGMGIFGIVDGVFAARYIDTYALSAVGLVSPFIIFALSIGFMFGVGGNALVAKEIGEGQLEWARKDFTLIAIVSFLASVLLAAFGAIFPDTILNILGVNADVHDISLQYLMPVLPFLPVGALGTVFQQFMMTEGKAHISMIATILSGFLGVFLNWLFLREMHMGIEGLAIATGIAYALPGIVCLVFFIFNGRGTLYFVKPKLKLFVLAKSASNGLSEMVTMLSAAITTTVMNNILMDIDGPMAVASAGIIGAGMGLVANTYIGFSAGIAPLISYNQGKRDAIKLGKIFKNSIFIIVLLAISMAGLLFAFTDAFIQIYDIDPIIYIGGFLVSLPVYDMAFTGLRMVSFGFVFMALNNFASIFFTSLNNGKISGIIAFCNGFLFIIMLIVLFSSLWGIDGVWIALPMADVLTVLVSVYFLIRYRKVYRYA